MSRGDCGRTLRTATIVAACALAAVAAACGRIEGKTLWEEALHEHQGRPAAPSAHEVYPVPKPPFSEGIFPCSRCHEGGEPVKDARPAMPHAAHISRGLECADCHLADGAAEPKVPAAAVCDTCHEDVEQRSEGVKAYFAAVTAADGKVELPRRWKTRDVVANHAGHAKAGVACAECHGDVADAPFAKPRAVALMGRCTACHEQRGQPAKCETCHTATPKGAHAAIVLDHAEEQRGCLDCHDAGDRDHLRLANGTKVSFEESFRLCGQCHGTQFRDWKIGLHGKRTGSWNGRREYRLCVHCHSPHAPKFPHMTPVARPARPEEVR